MEEHSNKDATPYLYNAKELDEETGLYYYGARYYDPVTSVWQSVDPLVLYDPVKEVEAYLDGQHNGGVFNSGNLASYSYTYGNPIKYVDPNGKQAFFMHGTTSSPSRWTQGSISTLMKLTNNSTCDASFSWQKHDGLFNNSTDRGIAADNMVKHIRQNRVKGEEITLIGHSHGGNVAIQTAKKYYKKYGERVNVITIATPAYNSKEGQSLLEDPNTSHGLNAINELYQIRNKTDGVQGGLAGEDTFNLWGSGTTESGNRYTRMGALIDVSSEYNSWEFLDAHSFDVDHPDLIGNQTQGHKLDPVD